MRRIQLAASTLALLSLTLLSLALPIGGCGETLVNQTASLGGRVAGPRGEVTVVIINNTSARAVFTVGTYDQTDASFSPTFRHFGRGAGSDDLEAGATSEIFALDCARVFSIEGPSLLDLIGRNTDDVVLDATAVEEARITFFLDPEEADEEGGEGSTDEDETSPSQAGTAPPFEALLGVDFPCEALLIIRLEVDDLNVGSFRVDFELIPSDSTR